MKPMPYAPYVKCDCGDKWLGVHYARPENHEWDYYSLKDLPDVSLTDAECAAEFWRVAHDELLSTMNADLDAGILAEHEAEIWHRFATTPHAFGGDS